jgi:hypothetical protein
VDVLLLVLTVVGVLPVWTHAFFPSQDGPDHLQNARILGELLWSEKSAFHEYYVVNPSLNPNWVLHLALAALLEVMPPRTAEKLLVTLYALLLPLAVRYALRAGGQPSHPVALLVAPLAFNGLVHLGFYSFAVSTALFFVAIGYWLARRGRMRPLNTLVLAALLVALFAAHPTSLVMALIGLGILAAFALAAARLPPAWARIRSVPDTRGLALLACAVLPAVALLATFVAQQGAARLPGRPAAVRLAQLPFMGLISFCVEEAWAGLALCVTMGALLVEAAGRRIRARRLEDGEALLLMGLVFLAVYLFMPGGLSGGSFIEQRQMLFPVFALLLWLGSRPASSFGRALAAVAATGLTVVLFLVRNGKYAELGGYLQEYVQAADGIERGRTLLPLAIRLRQLPDGRVVSGYVSPFQHASGYVTAERGVVSLHNHPASTPLFALSFRDDRNPYERIGRRVGEAFPFSTLENEPPQVEFASYPERTGGTVDYVLIWAGAEPPSADGPQARHIHEQLAGHYDLVARSPRGLARLYRRKGS